MEEINAYIDEKQSKLEEEAKKFTPPVVTPVFAPASTIIVPNQPNNGQNGNTENNGNDDNNVNNDNQKNQVGGEEQTEENKDENDNQ